MIKKFLIILLIPVLYFAQDQKNTSQNIELPEFVITGVERVSLPQVVKPKAELIPVLSEDFFTPAYSPEQLGVAEIPNPAKKNIDLFTKEPDFNGRLKVGVGTVSIPTGLLSYGTSYKNGTFFGKLYGVNQRKYIENAGLNNSGAELNNSFFINSTSSFLPGARFDIGGSYYRESYRFFASETPSYKRDSHFGEIHLNAGYQMNEDFRFSIGAADRPLYIKDAEFTENTFQSVISAEGGFRNFQLIGRFDYIGQKTDDKLSKKTGYNFISPRAYLRLKDTRNYKLEFGFNYTHFDGRNVFQPHAFAGLRLSSRVSVFGEYKPEARLLTSYDILKINRYFKIGSADNFMTEEKIAFKIALRYEYETFFEVDGGFRYADYETYPYFTDAPSSGIFEIRNIQPRRFTGFMNMLFHLGPFGIFYGDIAVEDFKDDSSNFVPYHSSVRSNLNYGYTFPFGLNSEARLNYSSSRYTDLPNKETVPGYIDLSLYFSFELFDKFDLFSEINNLLNNKNYYWKSYKEKPADFIIGIDYRW